MTTTQRAQLERQARTQAREAMTTVPAPAKPGPIVYADEQMLAALRRLSLGEPTLGRAAFLSRRRGDDPSYPLYERRFGSWNRALELAGLAVTEQPQQLQGATTKWSEDQLLDALRRCLSDAGSTTVAAYEAWRAGLPADRPAPPTATIRYRLRSWSRATALACLGDGARKEQP